LLGQFWHFYGRPCPLSAGFRVYNKWERPKHRVQPPITEVQEAYL